MVVTVAHHCPIPVCIGILCDCGMTYATALFVSAWLPATPLACSWVLSCGFSSVSIFRIRTPSPRSSATRSSSFASSTHGPHLRKTDLNCTLCYHNAEGIVPLPWSSATLTNSFASSTHGSHLVQQNKCTSLDLKHPFINMHRCDATKRTLCHPHRLLCQQHAWPSPSRRCASELQTCKIRNLSKYIAVAWVSRHSLLIRQRRQRWLVHTSLRSRRMLTWRITPFPAMQPCQWTEGGSHQVA